MIRLYPTGGPRATLEPGQKFRDWMSPHAYRCLPLVAANGLGWDVVTTEDVLAEWNGGPDKHDVVVHGGRIAESHFGVGTVTFQVGYTWRTDPGVQLLVMPVPNQDPADFYSLTAVVETDRLAYPWFASVRLTRANERIRIPAGTAIARVMPIRIADTVATRLATRPEPEDYLARREAHAEERAASTRPWIRVYHEQVAYPVIRTPALEEGARMEDFLAENGVLAVPGYLTAEECGALVGHVRASSPRQEDTDAYWAGRTYEMDGVPEELRRRLTAGVVAEAEAHYGRRMMLQDTHLVTWPEGTQMRPHSDYSGGLYPHRDYAVIVYLNDDYDGGELFLPTLDVELAPLAGSLVAIPGGKLFHGVKKVTAGTRYTCISWLKDMGT